MCTLILGRDVLGPGTVLLAANRDEQPRRPTDPPGVLVKHPQVVGGRDRMAGGTWLAIRDRGAAVAILNRREPGAPKAPRGGTPPGGPDLDVWAPRSRGLLAIDVATAEGPSLPAAALERARRSLAEATYAPFTLVFAAPDSCWALAHDGMRTTHQEIPSGWHAITHQDLDDPTEPRTAYVLGQLAGWPPRSAEAAERRVLDLLARHDEPRVCLHDGRMVTVSSSLVRIDARGARYLHAEGRPCEVPYRDLSTLVTRSETV
jgi:uncharacterized protein with NRDE domain